MTLIQSYEFWNSGPLGGEGYSEQFCGGVRPNFGGSQRSSGSVRTWRGIPGCAALKAPKCEKKVCPVVFTNQPGTAAFPRSIAVVMRAKERQFGRISRHTLPTVNTLVELLWPAIGNWDHRLRRQDKVDCKMKSLADPTDWVWDLGGYRARGGTFQDGFATVPRDFQRRHEHCHTACAWPGPQGGAARTALTFLMTNPAFAAGKGLLIA